MPYGPFGLYLGTKMGGEQPYILYVYLYLYISPITIITFAWEDEHPRPAIWDVKNRVADVTVQDVPRIMTQQSGLLLSPVLRPFTKFPDPIRMVVGKPVAMPRPKKFGGITGIDRVCGYNFGILQAFRTGYIKLMVTQTYVDQFEVFMVDSMKNHPEYDQKWLRLGLKS